MCLNKYFQLQQLSTHLAMVATPTHTHTHTHPYPHTPTHTPTHTHTHSQLAIVDLVMPCSTYQYPERDVIEEAVTTH